MGETEDLKQEFHRFFRNSFESGLRYVNPTNVLKDTILKQLNLEKNKIKGPFEQYNVSTIFGLLLQELCELKEALELKDTKNIMSEIGDVGAFLVGLIVKLESENSENEL